MILQALLFLLMAPAFVWVAAVFGIVLLVVVIVESIGDVIRKLRRK
jgi:hypothetical protein